MSCKEEGCLSEATHGKRCHEHFKQANRESFHRNKHKHGRYKYSAQTYWQRLWSKFKLTESDYQGILNSQGGGCALCGEVETGKRMPVDHNHDTGDVRGILCTSCNRGLGLMKDNAELLRKAAAYVEGDYS